MSGLELHNVHYVTRRLFAMAAGTATAIFLLQTLSLSQVLLDDDNCMNRHHALKALRSSSRGRTNTGVIKVAPLNSYKDSTSPLDRIRACTIE